MVTKTKESLQIEFAHRINKVCNDLQWPKKGRDNRTKQLINRLPFKISRTAVNKWFAGDSVPDATHIGYVANCLNVSLQWLATGKGPKEIPGTTIDMFHTEQFQQPQMMQQGYDNADKTTILANIKEKFDFTALSASKTQAMAAKLYQEGLEQGWIDDTTAGYLIAIMEESKKIHRNKAKDC